MLQNKITETKIKENMEKKKEDLEALIIENFEFGKSIYLIYFIILGSVFLCSIIKFTNYPTGSKECTDAYCQMVNSLNCVNALGVF